VRSAQGTFLARIFGWSAGPQVTTNDGSRNEFEIHFATAEGFVPATFEVLDLRPYMKIHGHGLPRAYLPRWSVAGNTVRVTDLGFIMSGPWEINVRARVDGTLDDIEIPVEVP
jgi:hypothetical protein